jgi:DNA-binding XRE family transcriptional regulator
MNDEREVIKCPRCRLVQFMTLNKHCRRCTCALVESAPITDVPITAVNPKQAITQILAKRLLQLRRARNHSQRTLAEIMEVPRTYVSKIEGGKCSPTITSLHGFAKALDFPLYFLLAPQGEYVAYLHYSTQQKAS